MSWNQNKVSLCYIENDHNFESTEDGATVFWKWTDFRIKNNSKAYDREINQNQDQRTKKN
jgi:hypothetical protein